jgi:hypothetical protein
MITLFPTPKSFRGHIVIIHLNAIHSWRLVHPDAEVLLFGNEEGAAEGARGLEARHKPEVHRNCKRPVIVSITHR